MKRSMYRQLRAQERSARSRFSRKFWKRLFSIPEANIVRTFSQMGVSVEKGVSKAAASEWRCNPSSHPRAHRQFLTWSKSRADFSKYVISIRTVRVTTIEMTIIMTMKMMIKDLNDTPCGRSAELEAVDTPKWCCTYSWHRPAQRRSTLGLKLY